MKNIVLCSVGDVIPTWLSDRKFDVCLIHYGRDESIRTKLKDLCETFIVNEHYKMPNYLLAFEKIDLNYDGFIFIDDDLVVDSNVLDACFKRLDEYHLDACQPSKRHNVSHGWDFIVLQKKGVFMEYTNFIECGFMCLSKSCLTKIMPYWHKFLTGWGVDIILHEFANKMAIFHDIHFYHPERKRTVLDKSGKVTCSNSIEKGLLKTFGYNVQSFTPKVLKSIKQTSLERPKA